MANELPHPTHFFKIIRGHSLHQGKLMIPRAFVEKFGGALPKTVFLKPTNGKEWKVTLVKTHGNMWFQQGWKEFEEHFSLDHGHLLVFKYQRTSHFKVQIFDMSALEVNYHVKREKGKRVSNSTQGNTKPSNGESSGNYRAGQKRKTNLGSESHQPCKMGSAGDVKDGNALKFQKKALQHTEKKCKGKQIITAKKATALDRANSFKPWNPYFLVFMHPSYFHPRNHYHLSIPAMFGEKHLVLGNNREDVQLRVLSGRSWPARCTIRKNGGQRRFEFSHGWKAFSEDNNLKEGDVCIFELIDETELTFMVHIFRESDNSSCSTSSRTRMIK